MKRKIYPIFLIALLNFFIISCGSDKFTTQSINTSSENNQKKSYMNFVISQLEKGEYKEGELLVKFKSGIVAASSTKTHQLIGATLIDRFEIIPNLELVRLNDNLTVKEAIIRYFNDPTVEYAEPNYLRKVSLLPNDQYFHQQWALHNTGNFASGTAGADIKAVQAWDIHTGNGAIVIAVLDTGIDYNHPDLSDNIWLNSAEIPTNGQDDDGNGLIDDWRGWNFVNNNNNPLDDNGHGTLVSGIIGAKGNNYIGIAGIMWNVRIMPLKFLNKNGEGTIADEIKAIQYAIFKGVKIINASYSGSVFSQAEYEAIAMANSVGVLFMAAAGNGGNDGIGDNNDFLPVYPANYGLPNIISVAATDQNDRRATFSNFGLKTVHVAAPGVFVISTVPTSLFPSAYAFSSGTSVATPHVSGLAGLLYSYYDHFTYSQIKETILRYVDILPTLSGWTQTGGRINSYRAISSLLLPTELKATAISPSQINISWVDNATGEEGYKIERRHGHGDYNQIASVIANTSTYSDTGLIDGTRYTYRVKAFNNIPADSLYSNEANAVTPLQTPTNLIATAVSTNQINLSWSDNSQAEEGYKIERKIVGVTEFIEIATVGANVKTFSDTGLSPFTTYIYRVRAFNSVAGHSPYSLEASATTFKEASSDGGGGCSIRLNKENSSSNIDILLVAIPLLYFVIYRFYKE